MKIYFIFHVYDMEYIKDTKTQQTFTTYFMNNTLLYEKYTNIISSTYIVYITFSAE